MKLSVHLFTALLCAFFSFASVTAKNLPVNNEEPASAYTGCFVQFTDGTIKKFTTLKMVTKMFKAPHLLADDSIAIYADELKAYQNEDGYALSQKEFGVNIKSLVAKDVLPGFAARVVKGHLNIFSVKYYNGQNVTEKFFMQNGDNAILQPCTPQVLQDVVKESNNALLVLSKKGINSTQKILTAAEIYNTEKLISKN